MANHNDNKAICIIDHHDKVIYMNDVYQVLFTDDKIGQETHLWDELTQREDGIYYQYKENRSLKIVKEEFNLNQEDGYIYTIDVIDNIYVDAMLKSTAYDELIEINITKDIYNILFYRKDKFVIPQISGTFSYRIGQIAQNIIHPDDQKEFIQFFNDIKENNNKNFKPIVGKFRRLLADDKYNWINGILINVSDARFGDIVYICFIQNMDMTPLDIKISEYDGYDQTTGLLNDRGFFKAARHLVENQKVDNCCLIAIDIEHFKLFNDWYGRKAGNEILRRIGLALQNVQKEYNTVAGYFGGDDFVIIVPNNQELIDNLLINLINHIKNFTVNPGFFPKLGIYLINKNEYIAPMYDRALIALTTIKGNYTKQISYYDKSVRQDFEYSQSVLRDTQQALINHEFTVYMQPKCNLLTGKIVGAEALVRWKHPIKGIIAPGNFVPILERNGFIVNLDMFVWQETCRLIKNWLEQGHRVMPISVNVSRTDIYAIDVVKKFKELVHQYNIPVKLIEIEITESSYASDYEIISKVVNDFRAEGFVVLMDDFGSGYSSLNMLKDVNVDILKIDMKFLELREESISRGVGILEAIVKMAKLMGLRVIAEGVETKQQVEFLNEMGCVYGQGYYYYSPLPISDFEKVMSDKGNMDYRGIILKQVEQIRIQDIFINDISSEAMLNNILGGIAFYQVSSKGIEIVKVNEIFYHVTKANEVDFENIRGKAIDFIYEEDQEIFINLFDSAYQNPIVGSEAIVRYYALDKTILWMNVRIFFLRKHDDSLIYYAAFSDVTKNNIQEQELQASKQTLNQLLGLPENAIVDECLDFKNSQTAISMFAKVVPAGILGCYRTKKMPIYFVNNEMLNLLGFDSLVEFNEISGGQLINIIHPDDRIQVYQAIGLEQTENYEYTVRYRILKKDNSWLWVQEKGRIVKAKNDQLAYICAIVDINETMQSKVKLERINQQLVQQNQQLSFLNECMLGGYFHCNADTELQFNYISESFLNITGFSATRIKEQYNNQLILLIHPDDRHKIINKILEGETSLNILYRINSVRGYLWVVNQLELHNHGNGKLWYGLIIDVTEREKLKDRLEAVVDNTPGDIFMMTPNKVEFFSSNLYKSLGYSYEEYCQYPKRSYDLVDKRDIYYVDQKFIEACRDKKNLDITYRVLQKNGNTAHVRMAAGYYEDELGNPCYYGNFTNVTEVIDTRKNNQIVIDNTMTVILLIRLKDDKKPEINMISIGILEKYGYTKQSFIKAYENEGINGFINENDYEVIKEDYKKAIFAKKDFNAVYRFELKNTTLWMDSKTKYLNTENGYHTYLCVLNDVTSLKQQEQEIWLTSKIINSVFRMADLNIWQYDYVTHDLMLMNIEKDCFIHRVLDFNEVDNIVINDYFEKVKYFDAINLQARKEIQKQLNNPNALNRFDYETAIIIEKNDTVWVKVVGEIIYDQDHNPLKLVGYFKDITIEKTSFRKYLENEKTLEALQEKSFYELSANLSQNHIINMNMRDDINDLTIDKFSDYVATMVEKVVKKEYQNKVNHVLNCNHIISLYKNGITSNSVIYKRSIDDKYRWMEATYHILDFQENDDIFCYLYIIDIDKQKRHELALKSKAERDSLTGLYNREAAIEEISSTLSSGQMKNGALLMLDMNDFKNINDSYGHVCGDKVIFKTAERLKQMFRDNDILCRIGGDEFMILCRNINEDAICRKLKDVTKKAQEPYLIDGHKIIAPLSIGFVMIADNSTKFNDLYKKADLALYKAKQDGLASYRMYQDDKNS